MTTTYQLAGMTCGSCVAKVETLFSTLDGVSDVKVRLDRQQAEVVANTPLSLDLIKAVFKDYPKYQINGVVSKTTRILEKIADESEIQIETHTRTWLETYRPILLVFAYITGVSVATSIHNGTIHGEVWMSNFMAGFFLVFSFFKFLNLKAFAESYAMYDIIAKRIPLYGSIYPFIELSLGIAYLLNFSPIYTNLVTLIVMGVSAIGVIQSVLNKRTIQCACLGAVFNLPMSTVTIIEDLLMVMMAIIMLFWHWKP